jgi:hypothetical protein
MHLCYLDESVDPDFFVLAAVLVPEGDWRANLDTMIRLRRHARSRYGIPITAELKAQHIRKGTGPIALMQKDTDARGAMFAKLLRWQRDNLSINVFAVAIDLGKLGPDGDGRTWAWKLTVERIQTFVSKQHSYAVLFPDAGHGYFIRRMVRKMRRFDLIQGRFGGVLKREAMHILEDPNDRQSHESLFVQIADWNAFAALRSQYIAPKIASFAGAWDELGDCRVAVETLTQNPPHIPGRKLYPKSKKPSGSDPESFFLRKSYPRHATGSD